jgi:uncharacterized protein YjiS (DUF1127 family)
MSAIRYGAAGVPVATIRQRASGHWADHAPSRLLALFGRWRRRARDRASLAALDERMLADIGISRAEAEFLSNKPFWTD